MKLEIIDRWSSRIPPAPWMTCVILTFDLLTWKWYATHHPLMDFICAWHEYNPRNRQLKKGNEAHRADTAWETDGQWNQFPKFYIPNLHSVFFFFFFFFFKFCIHYARNFIVVYTKNHTKILNNKPSQCWPYKYVVDICQNYLQMLWRNSPKDYQI